MRRLVLLALAAVAATQAASAQTPLSNALPAGTYRYEIRSGGSTTSRSTIVVTRDQGLVVTEHADLSGNPETTTRVLDPQTFSTRRWSGSNGDGTADTIDVDSGGATYRHGSETTRRAAAASTAAVFDFLVAEFAVLPAAIVAASAHRYDEYCVCVGGFNARPVVVAPATAPPPPGVPAGDPGFALSADGETITLWYDPQTLLMQQLDIPNERIVYVRV